MEDFDYIDALAKGELSGRTVSPSEDGWSNVQQLLNRKKKKRRLLIFLLLFVIVGSFGIYQGINFNSATNIENNSVVNKNVEQTKLGNADNSSVNTDSTSDSVSDSTLKNDASQAGTNTLVTQDVIRGNNVRQTSNSIQGNQNGITNTASKINSSLHNRKLDSTNDSESNLQNDQQYGISNVLIVEEDMEISADATGLKLYSWELIMPETLKKKRKKRKKSVKVADLYENLDLMVGLNSFFTPNEYEFSKSYVVEVSFTDEKKLKNNYFFNYGASLQFRNLRFKNDSVSFNRGELSLNVLTSIEKKFGNYGVEVGSYIGYEFYSPNNELFNNINANFFEQKINYGLTTGLNYKKVGLVFKYEFSPYIDYLGNKKFGGFTIGVKYDF